MVLTRSMATTNNVQEDEPPRSAALERQVQTLAAAVERLTNKTMIWRSNYDRGAQDTTSRRKTRGTAPNGGDLKDHRATTSPVDRSGET